LSSAPVDCAQAASADSAKATTPTPHMLRITASSLADSFGERYELAPADGS